ncbi:MAG TPA: FHIPEP family type III secretion protein, partial [Candidatus Dormibacteraeota bacterium]
AAALSDLLELAQIASIDRRAHVAIQCGRLAQARGSLDAAHEQYGEALRLAGDPAGSEFLEIRALLSLGQLAAVRGHWTAATRDLRHCLRRATALGHRAVALDARLGLAAMHQRRGDLALAEEQAERVRRALDGARSDQVARCHRVAGDTRRSGGRLAEAAEQYRRAWECALAFERHGEAAADAAASAGAAAELGRWAEAAEWTREAARLTDLVAAVAGYRPSPEAAEADSDNAAGLGHLFASGGTADGEIRSARDWFVAAAERLPERHRQTAWYTLNRAFAHRLLREQREAVEALGAVLDVQEGWTRSRALYRLAAGWGAEHGRALLRGGDARRAEQRFRSTMDAVRGSLPLHDVLALACGHADALVAQGRDDEAHAEVLSVLEQAAAGGDARAQVAARIRLAMGASTPVDRRLEHVRRCLELQTGIDHARGSDQLLDVVGELVALRLPAASYRRLRDAVSLTAASVDDPADRELLGRCALRLAVPAGWPGGRPRLGASVVLAVDPAIAGPDLVERRLPEAVDRVAADLGVPRIAATLRSDAELASGAYAIEVRQTVAARGRVRLGGVFLPDRPAAGWPAWAATDPLTGRAGVWLPASHDGASRDWDPPGFVLRHLEAVLRAHAASFLDVDAAAGLLARWREAGPSRLPAALDGRDGELLFCEVLRRLLDEGVPVSDVDTIVGGFRTIEAHPADAQYVVERVRLALAARLPGAVGSREVLALPRAVEVAIGRHVQTVAGKTFLALPPEEAERLRDAVLLLLGGRAPAGVALRVRSRALRPSVRRFTERFLPVLAVVSGAELARAREMAPWS